MAAWKPCKQNPSQQFVTPRVIMPNPPTLEIESLIAPVRHDVPDVTFGITHWLRLDALSECIASIHAYYPHARVDTQDTRGNLSWGRNQLVSRCTTPYFFLLEEDMELTRHTKVEAMQEMLAACPKLAGLGGGMLDIKYRRGRYCAANFRTDGVHGIVDSLEKDDQHEFIWCEFIYNWGLFRTDVLQTHPWDERLAMSEHDEFFVRMRRDTDYRFGCSRCVVRHKRMREDEEYRKAKMQRTFRYRETRDELLGGGLAGKHDKHIWKRVDGKV